ncbi:MAG: NADH:flavin oxidoreductase [Deferrisomatales bacterium]
MPGLFDPGRIGELPLANRLVRSATWEGLADGAGRCTPELTRLMVALARGGAGLLVTGHAYVTANGQASPRQLGAHGEGALPGLAALARAVHGAGGRIALQLAHGGAYALGGLDAAGPSPIAGAGGALCRPMGSEELREVVGAFGRAAERAARTGFDGVQVHAAHGYLLSQFLSPYYNRRTDAYGGSLQGRARLLLEVVEAVRRAVGPHLPVLVKLNSEDFIEGGLTVADAVRVAALLEEAGVDAVELSGGTSRGPSRFSPFRTEEEAPAQEAYYREAARAVRQRVGLPLILVGGIRSYGVAEGLLGEGTCDFIALSRPLIREPDLPRRWRSGDRRRSACASDNGCFGPARAGRGLRCVRK